jgi:pentatricopeptide repeat protein
MQLRMSSSSLLFLSNRQPVGFASRSFSDDSRYQNNNNRRRQKDLWTEAVVTEEDLDVPAAIRQAHRIIDSFQTNKQHGKNELDNNNDIKDFSYTNIKPELWLEAEDSLWQLSNARTPESVELTLRLLQDLITERTRLLSTPTLLSEQPQPESSANSNNNFANNHVRYVLEITDFLKNWHMWFSVLINWQRVVQVEVTKKEYTGNIPGVPNPPQLLRQLEEWQTILSKSTVAIHVNNSNDNQQQQPDHQQQQQQQTEPAPPVNLITSRALSLILDVAVRRAKVLADSSKLYSGTTPEVLQSAEFAESLFHRMIDMVEHSQDIDSPSNNNAFLPNTVNLNCLLSLWAKVGLVNRAFQVFVKAMEYHIPIDDRSYNALLSAYAAIGNGPLAEDILKEIYRSGTSVVPTIVSWNIVLTAWSRYNTDRKLAATRTQHILQILMNNANRTRHNQNNNNDNPENNHPNTSNEATQHALRQFWGTPPPYPPCDIVPDLNTFNTALSCFARAGEHEICVRLLLEMKEWYQQGKLISPPDQFSYVTVLNAFAKARQPEKAEELSDEMYREFMANGVAALKPTIRILTVILDAYLRSLKEAMLQREPERGRWCLDRAERVFQRMRELNRFGFLIQGPDTPACNAMLTCYLIMAQMESEDDLQSIQKAEALLDEMRQSVSNKQGDEIHGSESISAPSFKTYSIVIQMWLLKKDGFNKALQLLEEVWQILKTGDTRVRPDSYSLHLLIVHLCKLKKPFVAEQFLMNVCEVKRRDTSNFGEPKIATFGAILSAWVLCQNANAAKLANDFVRKVEDLYNSKVISEGPDNLMYKMLISCWASSKLKGAPDNAYMILQRMRYYASTGNTSMQPTCQTYNQVIQGFAKGRVNPFRAESVLREMYEDYKNGIEVAKPDVHCFNTVLSAWARFKSPESSDRAEYLFREMQRLQESKELDLKFDRLTFNCMLNCYAGSKDISKAECAEALLRLMKEKELSGDVSCSPDAVSYGTVIKAWVLAGDAGRAESVLIEMLNEFSKGKTSLKPQIKHFDQVATAWFEANFAEKRKELIEMKRKLYPFPPEEVELANIAAKMIR